MKTKPITKSSLVRMLCSLSPLQRLVLIAGLLFAPAGFGAEALVNGGFSSGLTGWRLDPALAGWDPLAEGGVALHPSDYSYTGTVLSQNLNVSGVSGGQAVLTLKFKKLSAQAGRTISVAADYRTAGGIARRVTLLRADNDSVSNDWTTVSSTNTLPAEAATLVRLLVSKDGYGDFVMDDASLSINPGTVGTVPLITSAGPLSGPLGNATLITLRGTGFGTTSGSVLIGAAPASLVGYSFGGSYAQVVSWTPTQIVARAVEPVRSGGIYVVAGGVEANGSFDFTVTSPNFTVDVVSSAITAVRGETRDLLLRVNFLNGFTSANGVNFFTVDPPGIGTSTDQPLKRNGGFRFTINTASLTNGIYRCMAQSLEDTSYARFIPFTVKIVSVTNIDVFEYDSNYQRVSLASKTVVKQGEVSLFSEVRDHEGNVVGAGGFGPPTAPPVSVVSSDPSRLLVFNGNFGPRYFALASGSVTLTFTTADGFSRVFPVTITLPATPRVILAAHSASPADNSGTVTNTFSLEATEPLGWIGYEGFLSITFDGLVRNNNSAYWPFQVPAGTAPGEYLFHGEAGGADRFAVLKVVNAANKGAVAGVRFIADAGGQGGPMDMLGAIEFYGPGQNLVSSNWVASYNTSAFLAGYIPPGTWKVRFVPVDPAYPPVWYPNESAFATASPVTVTAGTVTSNVNFYAVRAGQPATNLVVGSPQISLGRCEVNIPTQRGVIYALEAISSLGSTNWTTVQTLTGDGAVRLLADPAPPADGRFYRIRQSTP